jgi:microcin C transport system substrate-binding protein
LVRSSHPAVNLQLLAIAMLLPLCVVADRYPYEHGASYIEPLKYPPGFTHFEFVNPDAPKGGTVRFPELGTFDSFNNMIDKGRVANGIAFVGITNLIYDRLLEPAIDESASFYGRLAEGIWVSEDSKQVAFKIREDAYWHDGKPITADDVLFSFNIFLEDGSAGIRTALLELDRVEVIGDREILFTAKAETESNPTLPFTLGAFPVLPRHYWEERDWTKTTIEPPLGSGPYRVGEFELGRFVTFDRVDNYWGEALPVNLGRYNFDQVKYDYFRDEAIMLEALKGDVLDIRHETVSKTWATGYDFPAVKAGHFKKELLDLNRPWGMWWPTIWNLEVKPFDDIRVREAMWLLSDFRWFNRVLMHGFYKYGSSFFFNSEMAQRGLPSASELKLLEPWRDQVPARVFTEEFKEPSTTGYGYNRENIRRALTLFAEAGFEVRDGVMVNVETGEPLSIDFIFVSPMLLRGKMPFLGNLNKVGISTTARSPEVSNWLYRMRNGLFEGGSMNYTPSSTPGLEVRNRFSTQAADTELSENWAKIRNPVVDDLIGHIITATNSTDFYAATRALDRVLLWNFYFIPGMAQPGFRLVYWDKFGQPQHDLRLQRSVWLDTWWWDQGKADRVYAGMAELTGR